MRAVVCHEQELTVQDVPEPELTHGQVRLQVTRCGICGSDLHARTGLDDWAELAGEVGYDRFGRSSQQVVFGHEFSGVVAEHGPGCRKELAEGTPVVALPFIRNPDGVDLTGLSAFAPGAYAEQVVAQEPLMMPVPNGLAPEIAALTEPMAVAWHAVQRGEVRRRDVAIVIGCGPVGLGVILGLKAKGVRTVVASDYSPTRRALAQRCGADVVIDPAEGSPFADGAQRGHLVRADAGMDMVVDAREKLGRLPVGWWHAWRLADKVGATTPKRPVIFECVGVPGVIESIATEAPLFSRIVVVGVCVGTDQFRPAMAINKELDLRFVFAYTPLEFRDTLHMLADGKLDPRPLVTGTVGLDGVADAFTALADPEQHAKILIDPRR